MYSEQFLTFVNGEQRIPTNITHIAGFIVGDVLVADSIVSIVWTEDGIYSHHYYEEHQPNADEFIEHIGFLNYIA